MKCTSKEQEECNCEKLGCEGCNYEEGHMLDILQSFVDLVNVYKKDGKHLDWCENLKDDVMATEWAINKIEKLKEQRDYYKKLYLEHVNTLIKGGAKLNEQSRKT
jgi:hypothetical protein